MVHEHAIAFENRNAALRQEIQPIFFPGTVANVTEEFSIQNDADLARAVERLHKLALSNNEAIGSAFTISAQSSASARQVGGVLAVASEGRQVGEGNQPVSKCGQLSD